jgi:hypothetical protein
METPLLIALGSGNGYELNDDARLQLDKQLQLTRYWYFGEVVRHVMRV